MDLSIFLFRLFGFYFIFVGLAYFIRPDFFRQAVKELFGSPALLLFAAVINIILGLMLVLNYNVWEFSAKGFITVMGYLILAKGVSRLYFPVWGRALARLMLEGKSLFITGIITLILGVWLLARGFF